MPLQSPFNFWDTLQRHHIHVMDMLCQVTHLEAGYPLNRWICLSPALTEARIQQSANYLTLFVEKLTTKGSCMWWFTP